ncbi:TetR/AcrR family transcriptional regulator [Noviherbaspirillum sedimenti]|uniref:TetR/AcrR family transcriptional regulator n=1 Tax=Noviherbaspirillum sedimenti TaxID=2320865 RepID=A0A3A3G248_9BURK|nr:TetR/AcrR family transcriptional regulator [Noviherbaspirillum sedimenti]RJG02537.1 TetR/AcrR family transcriptional regulator [Noviherbaspirillum sedimenti]
MRQKKPAIRDEISTATGDDKKPVQQIEKPPRGKRRIEKSEQIREALLAATADVVGEKGYANTSIALITQKAGVAQGTFYNYFESRQEILDEVMPAVGRNMLAYIKGKLGTGQNFAELEDEQFRALFSFLQIAPKFSRILSEAYLFSLQGHKRHMETVFSNYMRFLMRSKTHGEFPGYEPHELAVIVPILMGARDYLARNYMQEEGGVPTLQNSVAETYMKFVRYGLEGVPPSTKPRKNAKSNKQ